MPLFFAVNGALLLPRKLDVRKHYRKLASIVAIIAIWKTLAALFFVVVDGTQSVSIKDFLKFQFGGAFGAYPTGYFWFMHALIAVYAVYPALKLVFDAGGMALRSLVVVLSAFTVGKDTAVVLLDMLGAASGHEFASILGGLSEFTVFGGYGYVALYFLVGGILGNIVVHPGENPPTAWPWNRIKLAVAMAAVVLCYVLLLGIQRFQHAVRGTNLTIDYGYWLLPTFVATILLLALCLMIRTDNHVAQTIITQSGQNTFGVYMLHLMAITLFAKVQQMPGFAAMGALRHGMVTVANIVFVLVIFVCCLLASCVLRRIPLVGKLFSL